MYTTPWEDGYNMAILGRTQTGKTAVARELHSTTSRLSIWLNEPGDKRVPNIEGRVVRSIEELRNAFADNCWRINFVSEDRDKDVVLLRRFLWRVAEATDRSLDIQVIADEVDRLAPQSGKEYGNLPPRDAVRDFCSEGVKRGIKWVGITQDPVTYDKVALRQSDYRLIFTMSAENRDAVSKYGFAWSEVDDGDRYTGVLHSAEGDVLNPNVKAAEAYA